MQHTVVPIDQIKPEQLSTIKIISSFTIFFVSSFERIKLNNYSICENRSVFDIFQQKQILNTAMS